MGKSGIIMSALIATGVFAFAYSFVSTQNPCAGAKDYASCINGQTKTDSVSLSTGVELIEPVLEQIETPEPVQTTRLIVQNTQSATAQQAADLAAKQQAIALAKQQTEAALAAQQAAAAQLAKQQAEADLLAQQQAEAILVAEQQAAAQQALSLSTKNYDDDDDDEYEDEEDEYEDEDDD